MSSSDTSIGQVVSRLRDEFPGVQLLALGQTVYWDEPMKAVLRRLLDEHYPEAVMLVGIHDTDYFSKIPASAGFSEGWRVLPHNDWSTKDLWVATGEISRLFGGEIVPGRDLLVQHGVQVDKAGKDFPGGREVYLDTVTEAWGWRGLVHIGDSDEIACCVPLSEALPSLTELVGWGLNSSLENLSDIDAERARAVANGLMSDIRMYSQAHPDASVADMFEAFLPRFYEHLLRYEPFHLLTTRSLHLFRFNRSTAHLKRFDIVGAFLNPDTRGACQEAYDLALEGSDVYTLDKFPEGAIPFDLAIPGVGRGTICLRDGGVVIDTPQPIELTSEKSPTTMGKLAELIEDRFGPDTALIGKAVSFVLMIAREFIFILNEEASAYVWRCEKMARLMKDGGVPMPFYPILRLDYNAWDAVGASQITFSLPAHLASAFRQGEITAQEFAESWRPVTAEQEAFLDRVSGITVTGELLEFLAERMGEPWHSRMKDYQGAYTLVRDLSERTEPLKQESVKLRDLSHQLKQEGQRTEAAKGEHFRRSIKPLRDQLWTLEQQGISEGREVEQIRTTLAAKEEERKRIEFEIERLHEEGMRARARHLEIKKQVETLEKSREASEARDTLKTIEQEAELAKLWLVREAILTTRGLKYTNHRPTAWWLMLADPEMGWFDRIVETTRLRFEEVDP